MDHDDIAMQWEEAVAAGETTLSLEDYMIDVISGLTDDAYERAREAQWDV